MWRSGRQGLPFDSNEFDLKLSVESRLNTFVDLLPGLNIIVAVQNAVNLTCWPCTPGWGFKPEGSLLAMPGGNATYWRL